MQRIFISIMIIICLILGYQLYNVNQSSKAELAFLNSKNYYHNLIMYHHSLGGLETALDDKDYDQIGYIAKFVMYVNRQSLSTDDDWFIISEKVMSAVKTLEHNMNESVRVKD